MKPYDQEPLLSWPFGNDVWLKIWLYKHELQNDEPVRLPYIPDANDILKVWVANDSQGRQLESYRDSEELNAVIAHVPWDLVHGTYGLGIEVTREQHHMLSFDCGVIGIVYDNEDAKTLLTRVGVRYQANVEVEFQIVHTAITQGKSAFEEWRELPGNEGKTLQDFINEVVNLNGITAAANEAIGNMTTLEQRVSSSEALRETAERHRTSDEQQRVANEQQREEAETQRGAAEQQRETAENSRQSHEQQREANEQQREEAETQRGTAEHQRELNEGQRNADFSQKIGEVNEALDDAEVAIEKGSHPCYVGEDYYVYMYDMQLHDYVRTNIYVKGGKGDPGRNGKDFRIYRTYASIAAMETDAANVPLTEFVLIASTVEDPDNAKLYVRSDDSVTGFVYLTDLSGAKGIKGDDGDSAYQIAVKHGYQGTEQQYNALYFDAVTAANNAAQAAITAARNAQEAAALAEQKAQLAAQAAQNAAGAENCDIQLVGSVVYVTNRNDITRSFDLVNEIGDLKEVLDEINGEVI